MKKKLYIFLPISMIIIFVSCSKNTSVDNPISNLQGTWSLISRTVQSKSYIVGVYNGISYATDTILNYSTSNNAGTINITADTIFSTGLSYSVTSTFLSHYYVNNVPQDSTYGPSDFTYNDNGNSVPYKKITSDSIYFPGGVTLTLPDTVSGVAITLIGAKISISGSC